MVSLAHANRFGSTVSITSPKCELYVQLTSDCGGGFFTLNGRQTACVKPEVENRRIVRSASNSAPAASCQLRARIDQSGEQVGPSVPRPFFVLIRVVKK